MFATMPSVAYARMMNCEAGAGEGEGITVGSGLGTAFVLMGVAEVEQDINKTASRPRLIKKRYILSKCQIQTMCELPHTLLEKPIQINYIILEHFFGDRA